MWDVEKESYHLSKTICHNYLSLNLKFLSLTRKNSVSFLTIMMIQRKDTPDVYLQDAQNLFNEDAEYGNWELTKSWR
jgi:hypothetical protein